MLRTKAHVYYKTHIIRNEIHIRKQSTMYVVYHYTVPLYTCTNRNIRWYRFTIHTIQHILVQYQQIVLHTIQHTLVSADCTTHQQHTLVSANCTTHHTTHPGISRLYYTPHNIPWYQHSLANQVLPGPYQQLPFFDSKSNLSQDEEQPRS